MSRVSTSWWDSSSCSQWNFNSAHSQEKVYFVMLSSDTIQKDLHKGMTVIFVRITRAIFEGPRVLCKFLTASHKIRKTRVMPSKNNSLTYTIGSNPYRFHVAQKLVQELFMVLLTFQLKIIWEIRFHEVTGKGRQIDHSSENGRLLHVDIHQYYWTVVKYKAFLSNCCGTFMHTWEKDITYESVLVICLTPSTRRTLQVMFVRALTWFQESRCYVNKVCARRHTHPFLLDDGVIFGENIVFVCGSYVHFLSVSKSWCLVFWRCPENQLVLAEWSDVLLWVLTFTWHNTDLLFVEEIVKPATRTTHRGALKNQDWSKFMKVNKLQ